MFEEGTRGRHALLLSFFGATLLAGSAGIAMSAKALVKPVFAACDGLECTSAADCGSRCFCNNPTNTTGHCFTNPPPPAP